MKRLCTAFGMILSLSALLVPMQAQAAHSGCYVLGEVQGLDTIKTCTYTASSTTQHVHVGTPYYWKVWVIRGVDDLGDPLEVVLAEGDGPVAGSPPQVHPFVGETVYVSMYAGITGPFYWTIGFLGAGLVQGHP